MSRTSKSGAPTRMRPGCTWLFQAGDTWRSQRVTVFSLGLFPKCVTASVGLKGGSAFDRFAWFRPPLSVDHDVLDSSIVFLETVSVFEIYPQKTPVLIQIAQDASEEICPLNADTHFMTSVQ